MQAVTRGRLARRGLAISAAAVLLSGGPAFAGGPDDNTAQPPPSDGGGQKHGEIYAEVSFPPANGHDGPGRGPLKSTDVNWSPPACWYAPMYGAKEYKEKFELNHVPGPNFHFEGVESPHVQIFFSLYFALTGVHALHMIIGFGLLSVAYSIYLIRHSVLAPLSGARQAMAGIAQGQFDIDIPQSDASEVAAFLNELRDIKDKFSGIHQEQEIDRRQVDEFKARLEAVFKHCPFGIFIKDLDGHFIMLNETDARIWRHPIEAFIGRMRRLFATLPFGRFDQVIAGWREAVPGAAPEAAPEPGSEHVGGSALRATR